MKSWFSGAGNRSVLRTRTFRGVILSAVIIASLGWCTASSSSRKPQTFPPRIEDSRSVRDIILSKEDERLGSSRSRQVMKTKPVPSINTRPATTLINPAFETASSTANPSFATNLGAIEATATFNGQPVEGVWVIAMRHNDFRVAAGGITDSNGKVRLSLAPDSYFLYSAHPEGKYTYGFTSDPPQQIFVEPNTNHATNFVVTPSDNYPATTNTGELSGTVVDLNTGQPVPHTWVILANENGPYKGTPTDTLGQYHLKDLAPRNYYVIALDTSGVRIASPDSGHPSLQNIAGSVDIISNALARYDPSLQVPTLTSELRSGQPLEEFPFPIMTESPHRPHYPVTDFAEVTQTTSGFTFTLPETTSDEGLYGRFWLTPEPPTPHAKLAGVRFNQAAWHGTTSNSIVVFSLLDRLTENNARGSVTGAAQGLPNELVGVLFEQSSSVIEMRLEQPMDLSENRFVAAVDAENLPMGQPSVIFPDIITVGSIEWLWTS